MQVRLTTTGPRTGARRTVTLYAFETPDGSLVITGSRGGNAALADLLAKLADLGLITDGTSA